LELIVYHNINTEKSIPAKRNVNHVPLDDTLIVVADDSVLPAPDALLDLKEFPANSRLS